MSRQGNYGKVGGRRSGSAAWQWLFLGGMFGLLCSAILVLTLLTLDVLSISSTDEPEEVIVQVTVPPEPTQQPAPTVDVNATVEAAVAAAVAQIPAEQPAEPTPETAEEIGEAVAVAPTEDTGEAAGVDTDTAAADDTAADSGNTLTEAEVQATVDAAVADALAQQQAEGGDTATDDSTSDAGTETEGGDTGTGGTLAEQPTPEPTPEVDPLLVSLASPLINITGGEFTMGTTPIEINVAIRECTNRDNGDCLPEYASDSIPQFPVRLDDFRVEATEVTLEQYIAFLNSDTMGPGSHVRGCSGQLCILTQGENEFSSIIFDGLNYAITAPELNQLPATTVTWFGANAYCETLGRRLLTEAEWEFAAKSPLDAIAQDDYPLGNRYPWGDNFEFGLAQTSRVEDAAGALVEPGGAVAVGSFSPSGDTLTTGISDMAGNVAEWVADYYDGTWYTQQQSLGVVVENPTGPIAARDRVLRGGSWAAVPFFARTMHRQHITPTDTLFWVGFRCGADAEQIAVGGDGNLDGLGDLGDDTATGAVGPDTEAVQEEDVNAAPTLPAAPELELPETDETEAPAVPPETQP